MLYCPLRKNQVLRIIKIRTGMNAAFYDQFCPGNKFLISQFFRNDLKLRFSISDGRTFSISVNIFIFRITFFLLPTSYRLR